MKLLPLFLLLSLFVLPSFSSIVADDDECSVDCEVKLYVVIWGEPDILHYYLLHKEFACHVGEGYTWYILVRTYDPMFPGGPNDMIVGWFSGQGVLDSGEQAVKVECPTVPPSVIGCELIATEWITCNYHQHTVVKEDVRIIVGP